MTHTHDWLLLLLLAFASAYLFVCKYACVYVVRRTWYLIQLSGSSVKWLESLVGGKNRLRENRQHFVIDFYFLVVVALWKGYCHKFTHNEMILGNASRVASSIDDATAHIYSTPYRSHVQWGILILWKRITHAHMHANKHKKDGSYLCSYIIDTTRSS